MNERKQTGKQSKYMCSGLVYCRCGAKMHGITTKRKGTRIPLFHLFREMRGPCRAYGRRGGRGEGIIENAAVRRKPASIADAMRAYQAGKSSRMEEFKQALKKRIDEKQAQYDALMQNLASGSLPAEVVADIGTRMKDLKEEIGPRNRPKISRPT